LAEVRIARNVKTIFTDVLSAAIYGVTIPGLHFEARSEVRGQITEVKNHDAFTSAI
jgi:hypothetical protein